MTTELNLADLLSAAAFAAEKHREQTRRDRWGTPYINHPIEVAKILACDAQVEDLSILIAALLHDTVEDTETTFEEIEKRFGREVSSLVKQMTDDKSLSKLERKRLQIETAPDKSDKAKLIKIADKISNVRDMDSESPKDWPTERKQAYVQWAIDVINGCRGVHEGLERMFDETVRETKARIKA